MRRVKNYIIEALTLPHFKRILRSGRIRSLAALLRSYFRLHYALFSECLSHCLDDVLD